LALALTYSRASFLSLVIWAFYYAIKRHRISFFIKTSLIVVLTLFLLPRPPGEGTKLERTSTIKAKIINYQQAISLYSQHPLFGIGYNRIGYYRPQVKSSSHARWGFDNSFLNIGIGNGLLLWLAFLILSSQLWVKSLNLQDFLLPAFICSLFSNALLYPYVMFLLLAFKYRKL
jgi:O-antigen ligase